VALAGDVDGGTALLGNGASKSLLSDFLMQHHFKATWHPYSVVLMGTLAAQLFGPFVNHGLCFVDSIGVSPGPIRV
jgi:hypothetical protein